MANWMAWVSWTTFLAGMAAQAPVDGLHFDKTLVQVGEVRSGMPLTHTFAFSNRGPGVVELLEARPGCGCLKPQFDRRRFAPGESGSVTVAINTLGQAAGPHVWQLTVVYREGEVVREKTLAVAATVVTDVTVQPASLTIFAEGALRHEILLTDLRAEPLTILKVESTSPHLRAQATPLTRNILGCFVSKIAVEIAPELPPGRHDEALVIHTSDPLYPELRVPIAVIKRER